MALRLKTDVTIKGQLILGLGSNGKVVFANNSNLNTVSFNSGVTTASANYTIPVTAPTLATSFLVSDTSGVMTWSSVTTVPTFAGIILNGTGSVNVNINSVSTNAIEDITSNSAGGVFQSLLESHTNTAATAPTIAAIKSRGTQAVPTISAINDAIGFHNFYGYTGNVSVGYQLASQVQYWTCADGTTISATSMPGRIQFFTTPDLSITPVERLRINCTGVIQLFGTLQMTGNRIYGDTGATGNLTLSANSSGNVDYLTLSASTVNRIQLYNGQPAVTATENVLYFNPTFSATPATNATHALINYTPTVTANPGAGALFSQTIINASPAVTFSGGLAFIYNAIVHAGTFTSTATPGFANTFNLFSGTPTMTSSTVSVPPISINGMFQSNPTVSAGNVSVGTTFTRCLTHTPTVTCTGASSAMTLSEDTAVFQAGTFNAATASGALTVTLRRLAAWKTFAATATGTVTITNNVGIDLEDQTASTGNLTVTNMFGIRSVLTSGTNRWFLYHSGTADSSIKGNLRLGDNTAPTALLDIAGTTTIASTGLVTRYNNIAAVAWGVPAIYGTGRFTAQTAAKASVAAYTVGAADGSFYVSANVLVTTSTVHNFTVTCAYTDEGNTARTLTLTFSNVGGTLLTAIVNTAGAVPYEGIPLHIRAKASTAITIATVGTFTTVTYNVEGSITQVA